MKNLIISSLIVVLLSISLWGVFSLYLSSGNQNEFQSFIENEDGYLFNTDLISYEKKLTGAKVHLILNSDNIVIDNYLNNLPLIVKIINGPIFLNSNAVNIGKSRWQIRIDKSLLDDKQKGTLDLLFPTVLPEVILWSDFDGNIHYRIYLASIFADVELIGVINFKKTTQQGIAFIKNLIHKSNGLEISANKMDLVYNTTKADVRNGIELNAILMSNNVKVNPNRSIDPVTFKFNSTANIKLNNNNISSVVKTLIDMNSVASLPLKNASLKLKLNQLSINGLENYFKTKQEMSDLKEQLNWTLEDQGEYPEGQDSLWLIQDSINHMSKQIPKILNNQLFDTDDKSVKINLITTSGSGKSSLKGFIDIVKNTTSIKMTWKELFNFEADVDLDNEMMTYLSSHTPINKKQFKLKFKQNKLLMQ